MSSSSTLPRSRRTTSSRASSVSSPDRRAISACRRRSRSASRSGATHPTTDASAPANPRTLPSRTSEDAGTSNARTLPSRASAVRRGWARARASVARVRDLVAVSARWLAAIRRGSTRSARAASSSMAWSSARSSARSSRVRRRVSASACRRCRSASADACSNRKPAARQTRSACACRSAVRATTARAASSRAPAQATGSSSGVGEEPRPQREKIGWPSASRRARNRPFPGRGGAGTGPHLGPDRVHPFPGRHRARTAPVAGRRLVTIGQGPGDEEVVAGCLLQALDRVVHLLPQLPLLAPGLLAVVGQPGLRLGEDLDGEQPLQQLAPIRPRRRAGTWRTPPAAAWPPG